MDVEQFLERVAHRGNLRSKVEARAVVYAVFEALRYRITHESGDKVAAQFPSELQRLWESDVTDHIDRMAVNVERIDLNEFIDKIRTHPELRNTGTFDAGIVTRAVFTTLQEQITPGAADKVASELPEDIREFWLSSAPEARPRESGVSGREARKEAPALERSYGEPQEEEMQAVPASAPMAGSPEGEYDSGRIGPSAASVFRSDDQLRSDIMDLLNASDEVDAKSIDVEVHAGKVILHGRVQTSAQREAVSRVAKDALGTTKVDNEINVSKGR